MKYFLTGERGIGKSYLIERIKPLISTVGFETRFEPEGMRLYMHFFNGLSFLIGNRVSGKMRICEEGFKEAARHLGGLEIPESTFLIMDEIGFLEEDSPEFQHAVIASIRRSKNCICVLRKGAFSFISSLKNSMGIRSIEIGLNNREELFNRFEKEIEKERATKPSPGGDEGI